MKRILLVVLASLALSSLANAAITLGLTPASPTGTGPYTWSWLAFLNADESLSTTTAGTCSQPAGPCTGSFLTIYDIAGLVPGSEVEPAGWTATEQTPGYTANNQLVTDTSVTNVTFWYEGSGTTGPGLIGTFSLISTDNQKSLGGTYSYLTGGDQVGSVDQGQGPTTVPSSAPEPASLGLIGASLLGLGAVARRRLKK